MNKKRKIGVIVTGAVIGLFSVLLVHFGNPGNMGVCVACFIRDIAGAVGLDRAEKLQYIRPEIIGFILGSFILSISTKEFKVTGGSSPLIRFVISFFVMIGALVFLGCPLRMILRLSAGDLNALVGLGGFVAGILLGTIFLKKGFSLGRAQTLPKVNGFVMPTLAVTLLVFLIVRPAFIYFSEEGPGSMHSPLIFALIVGLVIGALAQRSRMCMAGGIRDVFLIKDSTMLMGYIAIFVVALIGNLIIGNFKFGFAEQPIAHTEHVWNFLGMALVGLGSTLIGGCPLRQVILAGEGNTDAGISFIGLLFGAATAHNFGLASSGEGTTSNGRIAVIVGFIVMIVIGLTCIKKKKGVNK